MGATGNVVCTNANMAALTSGTFSLVVKVTAGTANGTVITGTVSVGSSAIDPISANNTASVRTIVGATGPNLSVTNVASPNPVQAGNNIIYTQVVTNTGTDGRNRRYVQRDECAGCKSYIPIGRGPGRVDLHRISR